MTIHTTAPELSGRDIELITQWVADLRSGEHQQAQQRLCDTVVTDDGAAVKGYCCMGVLALQDRLFEGQRVWKRGFDYAGRLAIYATADWDTVGRNSWLPESLTGFLTILAPDSIGNLSGRGLAYLLADLNDAKGWSFLQIAELLDGFFLRGLSWVDAYDAAAAL